MTPPDRKPPLDLDPRDYRETGARPGREPVFRPGGLKLLIVLIALVTALALWKTWTHTPPRDYLPPAKLSTSVVPPA